MIFIDELEREMERTLSMKKERRGSTVTSNTAATPKHMPQRVLSVTSDKDDAETAELSDERVSADALVNECCLLFTVKFHNVCQWNK